MKNSKSNGSIAHKINTVPLSVVHSTPKRAAKASTSDGFITSRRRPQSPVGQGASDVGTVRQQVSDKLRVSNKKIDALITYTQGQAVKSPTVRVLEAICRKWNACNADFKCVSKDVVASNRSDAYRAILARLDCVLDTVHAVSPDEWPQVAGM